MRKSYLTGYKMLVVFQVVVVVLVMGFITAGAAQNLSEWSENISGIDYLSDRIDP